MLCNILHLLIYFVYFKLNCIHKILLIINNMKQNLRKCVYKKMLFLFYVKNSMYKKNTTRLNVCYVPSRKKYSKVVC